VVGGWGGGGAGRGGGGLGGGGGREGVGEEGKRSPVDRQHPPALAGLGRPAFRHLNAVARGQGLQGLRKFQFFIEHQELENVPAGTAAEAVEQLLVRIHIERRSLLRVERTERPKFRA